MGTPVVDAHLHLWDHLRNPYPWLASPVPGSDVARLVEMVGCYDVGRYEHDMKEWNVVGTVHVQADWDPSDPVGETRWLQGLHDTRGIPTVIVAAARLEAPDVRTVLERHLAFPATRGIRQTIAWRDEDAVHGELIERRDWRRGFALLAPLGLSFDLTALPHQLESAAALAMAHPETSIVVDHAGMPGLAGDDRLRWRDGMRRLADVGRVAVKLSGLAQPGRSASQVEEYVEEVLTMFGPDRVMFGSNLPVEHLAGGAEPLLSVIVRALASRDESARHAVLVGTAARFYRMPMREGGGAGETV